MDGLERGYRGALRVAVKARWLVLLIALGVAGVGGYFFTQLKSELSPTEDRGTIIVSGQAPEGSSFAYTKRYAEQVEEILASVPELQSYLMIVGMGGEVTRFNSFGRLKDWSERDVSQQIDRTEDPAAITQGGRRPGLRLQSGFAWRARLRQAIPIRDPVLLEL